MNFAQQASHKSYDIDALLFIMTIDQSKISASKKNTAIHDEEENISFPCT